MGLRKLALDSFYTKYFIFLQVVNPPAHRLKELGVDRLAKLVLFIPDPVLLVEPDSAEPIDKITYEMNFIVDKMQLFLEEMLLKHARFLIPTPLATSQEELEQLCLKPLDPRGNSIFPPPRYCLLYFVNKAMEERNESWADRLNDMTILGKLAGERASSVALNVACYPSLLDSFRFQLTQVPLMVVYDRMVGKGLRTNHKLNVYDGKNLLQAVLNNQTDTKEWRPLSLHLGANRCDSAHKLDEDL